jgi:hypothetical protein
MGIYEYMCWREHVTELFVPLAERPNTTPCEICKEEAKLVMSATPTTFRSNDRKAFKRKHR